MGNAGGSFRWLAVWGPGLLVAATGVGAGDLATAAFTGQQLGTAVLWAVLVGAFIKFVLNEGLTRWQLATGQTLLEGAVLRLGRPVKIIFAVYFVLWSYFVGAALISACGAAGHAMMPIFDNADTGKQVFGVAHSVVALTLVWIGGFKLFEKVMGVAIAVMFVTVLVTAARLGPDWPEVMRGLFTPTLPDADGEAVGWTLALIGGVGGTLTVLCYGYWIREVGRDSIGHLRTCRIDLAVAYTFTALFGVAMVVIGGTIAAEGKSAALIVNLSDRLGQTLGPGGRWLFLIGAWAALFSSLLGVWQAVPYLFADFWNLLWGRRVQKVNTRGRPYRVYLLLLALVPMVALFEDFKQVQKVYAIAGALFLPLLALVLLVLNGRAAWVGERHRNRPITVAVLIATLAFFVIFGCFELRRKLGG